MLPRPSDKRLRSYQVHLHRTLWWTRRPGKQNFMLHCIFIYLFYFQQFLVDHKFTISRKLKILKHSTYFTSIEMKIFHICLSVYCASLHYECLPNLCSVPVCFALNITEPEEDPVGEQTYCRKWVFDKMSKIVLGHNGKKIFSKYRLGAKCRIFSFLILISFYLQFV
jgi:hypothetical protein